MIRTDISGFKHPYDRLNEISELEVGLLRLAWGLATLGNTGWRDFYYWSIPNILGIVSQASEIISNLETDHNGYVRTTNRYKSLINADLQTATYRMGAAITKCVVSKTIGVHLLQHVQPLIKQGIVKLKTETKNRPDYVGPDKAGGWHAIEAKGRSNNPGDIIYDAKMQAASVDRINGNPPVTTCACVSHLYEDPILIEFSDPEADGNEPGELILDVELYIRKYYAPFIDLINRNTEFTTLEISPNLGIGEYLVPIYMDSVVSIPENIRYGLSREIYQLLQSSQCSYEGVIRTLESFESIDIETETTFAGPDGTILTIE